MWRMTSICIALVLAMTAARGADAAPSLQLPWLNGEQHRINSGGYSYGCGGHTGDNANAIDFEFYVGQNVGAASPGPVTIASKGFNQGAGNYIEVDHGSGYKTRYLHLREDADGGPWPGGIGVGVVVSQGQHIGYSGNSGGVAAHLHFDMKLNGAAYPPEPMSGVRGFGNYGLCPGLNSPYWISRHPYDPQKVTDSTGDSRDDAVVFYQAIGDWYLAPSTGSSFGNHSNWRTGHGVGSNRQFAADVNNDGKTDSVVWFAWNGSWHVSLSTGGSYGPFSQWAIGHGNATSTNQFLADVNVDGKADAVVFYPGPGQWYVWLSNGSSFQPYPNAQTPWISGHGTGSTDQLLADATGDLKADAIVFFDVIGPPYGNGSWFVAASSGTNFQPYSNWAIGHGYTSDKRFVADVNGDYKQDAVVFFRGSGSWYVWLSTGSGFIRSPNTEPQTPWAVGHGTNSDNQMLADATGDAGNKADAIIYFGQPEQGLWYVAPSTGTAFSPVPTCCPWKSGFGIGS